MVKCVNILKDIAYYRNILEKGELKDAVNDRSHDLFNRLTIHQSQDYSGQHENSNKCIETFHVEKYGILGPKCEVHFRRGI